MAHSNLRPVEKGQQLAKKHGAEGALRRVIKGMPLAADDLQRQKEIVGELGYDPDELQTGPLGKLISIVPDNVLLAERFQQARLWAVEQGDIEKWAALSQRSGWRNDKAIKQLALLMELTAGDRTLDYEAMLQNEKVSQK